MFNQICFCEKKRLKQPIKFQSMLRLLFLCCSVIGFAQVEQESNLTPTKMTVSDSINQNIGLVGYQFYKGGFLSTKLSNNLNLQTGLLYMNTTNNVLVIDAPLLFNYKINNKFEAFFGSKLNLMIKDGISTLQPLGSGAKGIGVSGELGIRYDVSEKMMLELRYSLPIIEQPVSDPSAIDHYSGSLLRLGSRFKF